MYYKGDNMTVYILSIVGVVFLEAILDQILPEGKLSTIIRSVFAIFLLYIILKPISLISTNSFDIGQLFGLTIS